MNTLDHILISLALAGAFASGAVLIQLIDLDHRCRSCTFRDYVRAMFNGTYSYVAETGELLDRGSLHSVEALLVVFGLAAFWGGAALSLTLHYVGDYL